MTLSQTPFRGWYPCTRLCGGDSEVRALRLTLVGIQLSGYLNCQSPARGPIRPSPIHDVSRVAVEVFRELRRARNTGNELALDLLCRQPLIVT